MTELAVAVGLPWTNLLRATHLTAGRAASCAAARGTAKWLPQGVPPGVHVETLRDSTRGEAEAREQLQKPLECIWRLLLGWRPSLLG